MKTVNIFDTKLQEIVPHTVRVDANGEYVFESKSGRFFKLPATAEPKDFQMYFDLHEEANIGQISIEEQEAKLAQFLNQLDPKVAAKSTDIQV